jgi:DNA-binding HxlR family transcriptional regulator
VIRLVSNKWAVEVLFRLAQLKVVRFKELQRDLGRVTAKELTRQLRALERNGLVDRQVFAQVPVRVEYRLTARGRSLLTPLEGLARWELDIDAAARRTTAWG